MPTNPLWEPSLAYSEVDLRSMDSMLAMSDGTVLGSRPGARPGDQGLAVTLSSTTINVGAGVACLYRSGQSLYRAYLAATSPGSLAAANATYSRIDLVYLRVWDTAVDATGLRKADAVYLQGTAQAAPVAPSPGATEIYIPLATITVPPTGGGSPTVNTSVLPVTVAPGGILPVTSSADIALPGNYAGQTRYNTVRGCPEFWTGSAWAAQGDWQPFTPTWTANTTNPTLGSGTLTSRWTKIGRTVHWCGQLTCASNSTGGGSIWFMSLPTPAVAAGLIPRGIADYVVSGSNNYVGECTINPTDPGATFVVKTPGAPQSFGYVGATTPIPLTGTPTLAWSITYEAAS
ncbi:hypothetical protein [Kitasatospora sp. NPDC094011]|uniref:hypothetical protein n=1 Tax=Kitasatospora sp. NPDC094011 TaxID=3364090 RepID=UPI003819E90E